MPTYQEIRRMTREQRLQCYQKQALIEEIVPDALFTLPSWNLLIAKMFFLDPRFRIGQEFMFILRGQNDFVETVNVHIWRDEHNHRILEIASKHLLGRNIDHDLENTPLGDALEDEGFDLVVKEGISRHNRPQRILSLTPREKKEEVVEDDSYESHDDFSEQIDVWALLGSEGSGDARRRFGNKKGRRQGQRNRYFSGGHPEGNGGKKGGKKQRGNQ